MSKVSIMRSALLTTLALALSVGFVACGDDAEDVVKSIIDNNDVCPDPSSDSLAAAKVDAAPTIDGVADDEAWKGCLATLKVEVAANAVYTPEGCTDAPCYPGLTTTTVSIKSVYTDTDVYFVYSWADPTLDLVRYAWEKQADNSWKQLKNKDSSGHENTYYEDKFGIQWDMTSTNFATQGCYAGCHLDSNKANATYPGKKYNKPNELTDMWHWKGVRTNPNGQLDDKNVVGLDAMGNGRTNDSKTAGGYTDNTRGKLGLDCGTGAVTDVTAPCFMGPSGSETVADSVKGPFWIFEDEKQAFVDTFSAGDQIAAMLTAPFEGSRGDVSAVGEYKDGIWTLEVSRALTTGTPDEDVQFDDLTKEYLFGVAVFDNTQINHAVHGGVLKFTFEQEE